MANCLPRPLPQAPFTARQALVCGSMATLIDITLGSFQWKAVLHGALLNPDSYMRLVRLDDMLAAGRSIDVVARDGSGAGTLLYWSHLLDSILLTLAAPLAPWLGEHHALLWAGIALGPLSAGLLGIAVAWAAAPLSDPDWQWTAALMGSIALPVMAYAVPGVVHHHVLVAVSAVMCAGWAGRVWSATPGAGCMLGAWTAFGLWLSPEVMPIALMAFGAVGLGWLRHPGEMRWGIALAGAATMLAALVTLVLVVDPPVSDPLGIAIDRVSLPWLSLAGLAFVAGWWLVMLDRICLVASWRGWSGCGIAAVCGGTWVALFPSVLHGTGAVVHGADPTVFFDGISEMLPVASWADATMLLLLGAFAVIVAATAAIRYRAVEFAYVVTCLVVLVAAGVWHRRFSTYGACAGAIAVPVAITMINHRCRQYAPIWAASARLGLLLLLILAPLGAARFSDSAGDLAACNVQEVAPLMRAFDGQIVLADVNDTPELLYRTRLLTVGSQYHSNGAAFLRLRAAWRSQQLDNGVPPAVSATGASLVLFCRRTGRGMVGDLPPDTLWDRLSRNQPPAWLHEIPIPPDSGSFG